MEANHTFYDEQKCEWDVDGVDNLVMCLGDFNGHVGGHIDGFDGVHGGCKREAWRKVTLRERHGGR